MDPNEGGFGLVVHGGAGKWETERRDAALDGVREAIEVGSERLRGGDSALEAVVRAVCVLEDNPLFNAGTGSCLNVRGEVQMDASVMVGENREAGAVANLEEVKNPIVVARQVMEETDHVLLGGEGAKRFARAMGHEEYDPVTEEARERLRNFEQEMGSEDPAERWERMSRLLEEYPSLSRGTVGAVARDETGTLAAATSTGGRLGKLQGRIGDSPLPGAGSCASLDAAASATGEGEKIMRFLWTERFCRNVRDGRSAERAAELVFAFLEGKGKGGLIGLDRVGPPGVAHNTEAMPHGWYLQGMEDVRVEISV